MLRLSRWKIIAVTLSIVFGVLFTLPNVLPDANLAQLPEWLPHQKLHLGLDLQGGSYLLYEVDTDALRKERLTNLTEDIRLHLQQDKVLFADLSVVAGAVTFRVTDPTQTDAAATALTHVGGQLPGGGRDVIVSQGPNQTFKVSFVAQATGTDARQAVAQSIEIIRKRIDALGTKEPNIQPQGADRIVIEAPGESDPAKLRAIIGQTAKLTFQMVDETVGESDVRDNRIPPDDIVLPDADNQQQPLVLKKRVLVSGEMLTHAGQGFDGQTGAPAVDFSFNGQGARRFGDATSQNIGKRFAIVLDNKVISAPVIRGAILGGSGQITGSYTVETAQQLSILLNSGALPAPLIIQEQRTVGAELGADAVRAGAISLAIGGALIFVFIILAYGLFGVFAALALVVNVLIMFGALSMTQATLTLPGIAGLILTMAVAVDANVLIYERMRDEANTGRAPMAAADAGFRRALVSIVDADITTMIAALIMFQFGAGPVRGFAWTLSIGVITSVFTAVLITQLLIGWWFRVARPKALPIA
ncbi:MAG: protein translocase subunit SecD [Caulobacterales bacterium]